MRYELTDEEWTAIKPMLPNKPRGVPRVNGRRVLNGIFWVLRSGAPWRDLPINSVIRVHQHGACITRNKSQSMGRSRGGLTNKIHAVVDTNGLPVRLVLTAGEAHDNRLAGKLLSRLESGTTLLADRGYDADWIRALAAERGVWANIPPRCNRNEPICFSPYLYRARNLVERFFNRSSTVAAWQRGTTNLRPTTSHSFNLHPYAYGCGLMSPRPSMEYRACAQLAKLSEYRLKKALQPLAAALHCHEL
jgi:transposase